MAFDECKNGNGEESRQESNCHRGHKMRGKKITFSVTIFSDVSLIFTRTWFLLRVSYEIEAFLRTSSPPSIINPEFSDPSSIRFHAYDFLFRRRRQAPVNFSNLWNSIFPDPDPKVWDLSSLHLLPDPTQQVLSNHIPPLQELFHHLCLDPRPLGLPLNEAADESAKQATT